MAAVRLARAGASVSLFDPSHPREKPCGGGITSRALALLEGVIDVSALPAVVIKSALVEPWAPAPDQLPAGVPLIDRGPTAGSSLLVFSRAVFDRALLGAAVAAGARLIPQRVVSVSKQRSAMVVRTDRAEYESDFLLGADGTNSLVRKTLASPFTRAQLSTAAGYFVCGPRDSNIVMTNTTGYPGYLWSFPRPDHLAVGVCAPADHRVSSSRLRADSETWITTHGFGANGGVSKTRRLLPYAWPIPTVGHDDAMRMICGGGGWMLLGDAAGLVDPLTREGIYYALLSGIWAAEALIAGSRSPATSLYAERLRTEVQPELARAAAWSRVFFSPPFASLLIDALRQSSSIRHVFVDLVAGAQPYRGLRRRLLATGEWRLAGRAIRSTIRRSGRPKHYQ